MHERAAEALRVYLGERAVGPGLSDAGVRSL
jgi:hypothetical protein